MECVWDDGSFDSADDPRTGKEGNCEVDGGTYVRPDLFENSQLTNGQRANYQRGDWSSQANSTLQQSWVGSSATVSADPRACFINRFCLKLGTSSRGGWFDELLA
jgi:hypothetical protein